VKNEGIEKLSQEIQQEEIVRVKRLEEASLGHLQGVVLSELIFG